MLLKFLKQIEVKKREARRKHLVKTKGRVMVAWISIKWKWKLKKRGGAVHTIDNINKNRLRHALTIGTLRTQHSKAIACLKQFLLPTCGNLSAIESIKSFNLDISFI